MDECSLLCSLNENCEFWLWQEGDCTLKSDQGTTSTSLTSFYGSKNCVGRVGEPKDGVARVDGNWSPWSTIATPCFKPRTGQLVNCGGGVQYRYVCLI